MRTPIVLPELHPPGLRRAAVLAAAVVVSLAVGTMAVAFLEGGSVGITDASPVYLVAVVVVGSRFGTLPALITAIAAVLVYDALFIEPRFSFVVADPRDWLDLVLFLFLAVVVGRLSALGSERAVEASRRASESTALFAISRILAIAPTLEAAASEIAARLVRETGFERVWITTERAGRSTVLADSSPGDPLPSSPFTTSLIRTPGDAPARWVRSHEPAMTGTAAAGDPKAEIVRVKMEADGAAAGSVRAARRRVSSPPSRETTRLLALAADQLALAIRREELRREATDVEIARQGDALKSALVDAVSHDLRTPLASIRAAAGALTDRDVPIGEDAARAAGAAIDLEAQRLDRLVREVLDLSRIEAGALRPQVEALDLRDVVEPVIDRLRPTLGDRPVTIDLPDTLPPVRADAVLLDTLIANLVENASHYAPEPAAVAISASAEEGWIRIDVEDAGPGVPDEALARLFDKFYRVERRGGSRRGLGIGLAVVRAMAEAMGGQVEAEASPLGGLRVRVRLPIAEIPPVEPRTGPATSLPATAPAAPPTPVSTPGS